MSNFRGIIAMDLKRAFISPLFFAAILLVLLNSVASIGTEFVNFGNGTQFVLYYFDTFMLQGSLVLVYPFIGIIPYGMSFCIDYNCQYIRSILIRTDKRTYTCSKVIATACSAFVSVLVGLLLSACLLITQMPLATEEYITNMSQGYSNGLVPVLHISPMLYILARSVIISVSAAFWAVFALFVSSFVTNVFVIFSAPIIAYYVTINFITNNSPIIKFSYINNALAFQDIPGMAFLYPILFYSMLVIFLAVFFNASVKRKTS